VRDGRLLAAERAHPAALAGRWELPGGKVEDGEDERAALVRECREELGVEIAVGCRVGPDLPTEGTAGVLRAYACTVVSGEPVAHEHRSVRWLAADELGAVPWLRSDLALLPALEELLRAGPS
jgi:8-oxo-dGTP diphosphatase